jgi:ParB-like chromosome segregation protein Spo0J
MVNRGHSLRVTLPSRQAKSDCRGCAARYYRAMPVAQKSARRQRSPAAVPLGFITADLRPLARPIGLFSFDARNAKSHGERSVAEIRRSLERYGQRKPIVAERYTGRVIAGNGTLQAALSLGWSHVAAVLVDDDPATATGYAIADNRAAEFATWNDGQLLELLAELDDAGVVASDVGFNAAELDRLSRQLIGGATHEERDSEDQSGALERRLQVLVDCADESDQLSFLQDMQAAGRTCRVLNT